MSLDSIPLSLLPRPITPAHSACSACSLAANRPRSIGIPTCLIPGSLAPSPSHPALLVLGQNPGWTEDATGLPFIGDSGEVAREFIIKPLLALATIYISNTARCYHVVGDGPTNAHYTACSNLYLPPDLTAIAPPHSSSLTLLCLGAPAATHAHRVLGLPKVTQKSAFTTQGRQLPFPTGPITLYSTYHPAAVLREHNLFNPFHAHLQLLRLHLLGRKPLPSPPRLIAPCLPSAFPQDPTHVNHPGP